MASAGAVLAMHFATWVPSLRFTSVASATALVATQPIWVAFIAARRGAHIPRRAWIGIAVAFTGVVVITGVDFAVSPAALVGDGLALLGGALAAVYISVGEEARQAVSTSVYTSTVYAVAAMALILIALVGRIPLVGFSVRDWTLILLLTAGAQLLGHTLVNRVIETTSATVVSLAILLEVPGAIVIASWWLGQTPPLSIIPAVALLFAGLTLVIASGDRRTPSETPPV